MLYMSSTKVKEDELKNAGNAVGNLVGIHKNLVDSIDEAGELLSSLSDEHDGFLSSSISTLLDQIDYVDSFNGQIQKLGDDALFSSSQYRNADAQLSSNLSTSFGSSGGFGNSGGSGGSSFGGSGGSGSSSSGGSGGSGSSSSGGSGGSSSRGSVGSGSGGSNNDFGLNSSLSGDKAMNNYEKMQQMGEISNKINFELITFKYDSNSDKWKIMFEEKQLGNIKSSVFSKFLKNDILDKNKTYKFSDLKDNITISDIMKSRENNIQNVNSYKYGQLI